MERIEKLGLGSRYEDKCVATPQNESSCRFWRYRVICIVGKVMKSPLRGEKIILICHLGPEL